ncbi:MAG: SDR family NAD(P)-dependent oxidoreductase [Clostridia bacterium]|nr:SDR family NAD(P)-dependent oxidoreductase [Clostridia bacterium]
MNEAKKTVVITGASDGIGKAAAKQLKNLGHKVVITGRNSEKTMAVAKELEVPYHLCDYADLSQVVRLAEELAAYERIDVLANNAGGLQTALAKTKDGFDKTFQVNLLAGLLLTLLLKEKLIESGATVIQTSSIASNLYGSDFDPSDLQNEHAASVRKAYGYSKLEDALMTRELQRRFGAEGIHAVAFEPGVARTNFASDAKGFLGAFYRSPLRYPFTISPEKGAERLTRLAIGTPNTDFIPGELYSYKKIYRLKFKDPDGMIAKKFFDDCLNLLSPYLA